MSSEDGAQPERWDEEVSQTFLDYGRYVIPEREQQIEIIAALLPNSDHPTAAIDLCCGEGLLAQAILEKRPAMTVYGLDGSGTMLERAQENLSHFGERFQPWGFDLFDRLWPDVSEPILAVVSSLAIHHLRGSQKRALFREIYALLVGGGIFVIADIIAPAHAAGWQVAAHAWDEAVRQRSQELDGNSRGFDFFESQRWNTFRYFDPKDIDRPSRLFDQLKWLEQAGFADVDIFWMRAGHAIFGGRKASNE
jgi:tRNA (cmo5U34)-methyltransferase